MPPPRFQRNQAGKLILADTPAAYAVKNRPGRQYIPPAPHDVVVEEARRRVVSEADSEAIEMKASSTTTRRTTELLHLVTSSKPITPSTVGKILSPKKKKEFQRRLVTHVSEFDASISDSELVAAVEQAEAGNVLETAVPVPTSEPKSHTSRLAPVFEMTPPVCTPPSHSQGASNTNPSEFAARKHVRCLQDPPRVVLYTQVGSVKKGEHVLPVFRCGRGSASLECFHLHLNRFIPGTVVKDSLFQAYLVEGLSRWNRNRASAPTTDSDSGSMPYSDLLCHTANNLALRILEKKRYPSFVPPRKYTGELIGVEYLYSQTGDVLQNGAAIELLESTDLPDDQLQETDEGFEEEVQDLTVSTLLPDDENQSLRWYGKEYCSKTSSNSSWNAVMPGSHVSSSGIKPLLLPYSLGSTAPQPPPHASPVPSPPPVCSALPPVLPSVCSVLPPVSAAQPPLTTVVPQMSDVLPPLTTVLPPVSAVLPPVPAVVPAVLPSVCSVLPPVSAAQPPPTVVPQVSDVLPPLKTVLPPLSAMLPHVPAVLPPVSAAVLPPVSSVLQPVSAAALPSAGKIPPRRSFQSYKEDCCSRC